MKVEIIFVLFILLLHDGVDCSRRRKFGKPSYSEVVKPKISFMGTNQNNRNANDLQQRIQLFSESGQNGVSTSIIVDYVTDLNDYGFDNKASSACLNGIWIMYEDYNFVPDLNPNVAVFYAWGDNYCLDFDAYFDKKASSMRYVGPPDGYKYDTINLYEGDYFVGKEQYAYMDQTQLNYDYLGASIIITGCSSWTIYTEDYFQGESLCLQPVDSENCYPTFFEEKNQLGNLANHVSSVRKGCYGKKIMTRKSNVMKNVATKNLDHSHSNKKNNY